MKRSSLFSPGIVEHPEANSETQVRDKTLSVTGFSPIHSASIVADEKTSCTASQDLTCGAFLRVYVLNVYASRRMKRAELEAFLEDDRVLPKPDHVTFRLNRKLNRFLKMSATLHGVDTSTIARLAVQQWAEKEGYSATSL